MRYLPLLAPLLLAPVVSLVTPSQARACGGTFCDGGPAPMPVDQRGEDILFVQDGPELEVHVRIQYEGEAERFAWVVPLYAVPEISVGSDPLFVRLTEGTAPRWSRTRDCAPPSSTSFTPALDLGSDDGPEVVLETTVGAFEVVVLQGGTAAEVIQFLGDNGYAQDPAATPILQEYLDEGFLFAAVKLTASASTDSIHPLVFRFTGDEPCVPIRLTRIAAEQDMGIRVYFLGQERWAPRNYQHVVLNPLAFPWSEVGAGPNLDQYVELLTLAVDAAGGHAFATDFAGRSSVVDTSDIYQPSWDEAAFVGLDMIETIQQIQVQGLWIHPLLQPLLIEFMPPPADLKPWQYWSYWNNIGKHVTRAEYEAWDSAQFAAALAERIIEPGLHAVDLLDAWPHLTRLHTTMSPHEMTVDPTFHPAPDLGEVLSILRATSRESCGDNNFGDVFTVPFEDQPVPVCLNDPLLRWPAKLQTYPALRIEQIPATGPAQVIADFGELILAEHADYETQVDCSEPPSSSGGDGDGAWPGDRNSLESSRVDCACRSDALGSAQDALFGLLGLAGLGAWRRRRTAR
jgi:MYXO-CTERM domain-containing protein